MQDYVIGVDIGGTNIRAGALDYKGNIIARKRILTVAGAGSESVLDNLEALVADVRAEVGSNYRLKAVGFGVPGAVMYKTGVVTQAPNLPGWDGLAIQEMLLERLQVPCFIENDANAIALGEMWLGAGRGFDHICCLTLGTGVGGGVVIEGELLRGADGMAAELGHISIKADGPQCKCGSFGCLESYASATGILRMLAETLPGRNSTLSSLPLETITPLTIYEHAKSGDMLSREIFEIAGAHLGVGIASLINIFNPEIFIIGGGVAAAWDILMPSAIQKVQERAFKVPAARAKIVRAERDDDAGIYGSAYVAWDHLQHADFGLSRERSMTPWGFWQVLEEGRDYKVKRIYVHPGHRLSYQKHSQREETWMIASGEAQIVIDDQERRLRAGETVHIGTQQAHRIGNPGEQPLVFFEVQRGTYFGEDDIVRLQDDYKR